MLLVGAMLPRAIRTRKVWPAGVMAVAGLASTAYHGQKSWEWNAA